MVSLKYDNERLQQLIQQKGISPSSVLNKQNKSLSEHRLNLGNPAGLGMYHAYCCTRDCMKVISFALSVIFLLAQKTKWIDFCGILGRIDIIIGPYNQMSSS